MGWNVRAIIEGKYEFSLMRFYVPTLYGFVRKQLVVLNLLAGSCEFTCLKFGVPTLTGGKLGLTSGWLCVSTLYRERLGVFLCINMSALYVYARVF